ncbi:MAG: malate synthase [Deltaproteobacteria bacterium]|nr:malate synthase [Deltaproteobacteria bacterium]
MKANHNLARTISGERPAPTAPKGVVLNPAAWTFLAGELLTPEAMLLLAELHRKFEPQRQQLMDARRERQQALNAGALPTYEPRASEAVQGAWRVSPIPEDLRRRRVEITGPADSAKMVINMLSRQKNGVRADTAMLDLEDACMPSWHNITQGLSNIAAAARGDLTHHEPSREGTGERIYKLTREDMAVLIVRPRGLHLRESNFQVDRQPISASLFDLSLSVLHTAQTLLGQGRTPTYYIPKCEHYLEARWWEQVLTFLEGKIGLPFGALKATFLIETLPAALQMEEILYEARAHAVGLNVGRWDKIFSDIKTLQMHPDHVLADRGKITMQKPWMSNYALRCVQICHQRGALALGGMSAFTPGRSEEIRAAQTAKVLADKQQENQGGHDGCWVSHPYFIGVAMQAFPRDNQLDVIHTHRDRYPDLIPKGEPDRTLQGLRTNIRVGIGYLEGWSRGLGCVAWDNLMEDLATLEISRAQTWQWLHHGVTLLDGQKVTGALVSRVFSEELERITDEECPEIAEQRGESVEAVRENFAQAAQQAKEIFLRETLSDFLTMESPLAV